MLTGELRSQVNSIWDSFWSGGISNPLEVMEQITYLLFIRRLDDAHTLEESKALILKQPMKKRIFPEGKDAKGSWLRASMRVSLNEVLGLLTSLPGQN